jgi:protein CpxP
MNKLIIAMVTTLLLTASSISLAQDQKYAAGKKGQRDHRGMPAMPVVEQLTRAIRHLDLDDEQKAGIRVVMQDMKAEVRPIMEEMKAGHVQLRELVKAESYDEQAVAVIAKEEGNLAAERVKIASRTMSKILAILTVEQREQLGNMAAERKSRHGERKEGRVKDI